MICFEKVCFTYDGSNFVLDDVSLTIERGSFVCILGGNGSGKSTFAKHINALLVPDEGRVTVFDLDTADEKNVYFIRSGAGMVFQNPDDQLVASLIENDVAFGPENLGVPTEELQTRVMDALAEVGLQGFNKRETHALSGGQKQRVAIAGVLAMNPQILILDEASAMLDPRGRKGLLRVCKELNDRGMTIVMITHFMEEASLADRVVVLEDGRIALDGSPQEVLTRAEELGRLNLNVPFACELSLALQKRGVPIQIHISEDGLKEELCRLLSIR
ncbi:MAG: energy-coupling factor transporter ATPase [Eggerthellaceae bacterium]|nr:energy-coupling factor transporter ATPase [Eggerthellaceae bacterium]